MSSCIYSKFQIKYGLYQIFNKINYGITLYYPQKKSRLFFYCISLILFFLKSGNNFVLPPRFGKKGSVTIVYIWLLLFILEKWYALKQQLLLSQKLSFYVIILSKNFNATVQILTFFTQDMLRFSFFCLFFILSLFLNKILFVSLMKITYFPCPFKTLFTIGMRLENILRLLSFSFKF